MMNDVKNGFKNEGQSMKNKENVPEKSVNNEDEAIMKNENGENDVLNMKNGMKAPDVKIETMKTVKDDTMNDEKAMNDGMIVPGLKMENIKSGENDD